MATGKAHALLKTNKIEFGPVVRTKGGTAIYSMAYGSSGITFNGAFTPTGDVNITGNLSASGSVVITGNLDVDGNFTFGDVAADVLTITGYELFDETARAIGTDYGDSCTTCITLGSATTGIKAGAGDLISYVIDVNGATVSTAELRLRNGATIDNDGALTITEGTIALVGAVTVSDGLDLGDTSTTCVTLGSCTTGIKATTGDLLSYGIDFNGATISTSDIRLNAGALIANSTDDLDITETNINLVGNVDIGGAQRAIGLNIDPASGSFVSGIDVGDACVTGLVLGDCTNGITATAGDTISGYVIDVNGATVSTAEFRLASGATIANASNLTLTETIIELVGAVTISNGLDLGDSATTCVTLGSCTTGIKATTGDLLSYGIDFNGATISSADIRLNDGATITNTSGTLTITEDTIDVTGATAITLEGPVNVAGAQRVSGVNIQSSTGSFVNAIECNSTDSGGTQVGIGSAIIVAADSDAQLLVRINSTNYKIPAYTA